MITGAATSRTATYRLRRARLGLAVLVLGAALLVGMVIVVRLFALSDLHQSAPPPKVPSQSHDQSAGGGPEWDWLGEAALAGRPMLALPAEAAGPQPLASNPAAGEMHLPVATGTIAGIPAGFPETPAGAVAALSALTTEGLRGADPQIYAHAYSALSAPGAPPPAQARLTSMLTSLRSSAGLPSTGAAPNLVMSWQPEQAQIKGVLDNGRYVVACVLGQFTADYQGRLVVYGVGDCQALRWISGNATTGATGQWLVSPGPAAAVAPDAWPGSQDAVNAGYQALR